MKYSIITFFLSLILATTLLDGATRFVQPNDVLQDVIDASSSGDVIAIVKSPCGTGSIQGKDLTLRGVNDVMPVIGTLDINNSKVNLLKVQVGALNVSESGGQKSHLFAHACDLLGSINNHASTTRMQYCKVYRLKINKQAEIVGCEFNGNQNKGIGIDVMPTGRATINNNRIYDYNGSLHVLYAQDHQMIGIRVRSGATASIENNIIYNCMNSYNLKVHNHNSPDSSSRGIGILAESQSTVTINGNAIWECANKAYRGAPLSALINAPANAVIEHNLLYNDANTLRKITGGCQSFYEIDADPKFTDLANGDFTLASDSPCIDKGPPDAQYTDHNGSRNDIGMFGGHNYIPNGRNTDKPIVLSLDMPIAVPAGGTVTIESTGTTVK
jgi:nitrous oxidase accessory protein NosD